MTRTQFITTLLLTIPGVGWLRRKTQGKCPFNIKLLQDRINFLRKYPLTPDECFIGRKGDVSIDEVGKVKHVRGTLVWDKDKKSHVKFTPDDNGNITIYHS